MKKRLRYYVDPKNPLLWLAVLFFAASAGFRIASICEKGADTATVWFALILPVLASLIYIWILLAAGRERFYKTAIAVFLFALYLAIRAYWQQMGFWLLLLHWLLYLVLSVFYRQVTAGRVRQLPLLWLVHVVICAYFVYELKPLSPLSWQILLRAPDLMFAVGLLLASLCMRLHNDGKYHPTWGDRTDGRRVRSIEPMARVQSYIMPNRNGSSNLLRDSIEITSLERWIREKRQQGLESFGVTEAFLAAYVRCIARYPACNRFLSGQRVYSRDDDIQFCMVVKKEMTKEAPDTIIKLHLTPADTAADVYEKFHAAVEEVRTTELDSSFDNTAAALASLPGVILKFAVWVLKTMDYFGLIPRFLLEVSPFHGSVFFTSMGSLGIAPVFHHLYDFGNLPVFCAFGKKRRQYELQADGSIRTARYIDYTFTIDERTVDGFYYAATMRYFQRILKNPSILDEKPEVLRDID